MPNPRTVGTYNLDAIREIHEQVYLHIHHKFREFVAQCEDNRGSSSAVTSSIAGYWGRSLVGLPTDMDDGVREAQILMRTRRSEDLNITPAEIAEICDAAQKTYRFAVTKNIGSPENPESHTITITVEMVMKWQNSYTHKDLTFDPCNCKVTIKEAIDSNPPFGCLTNYKRTGTYRESNTFMIYAENSSFLLSVHMMFLKSQICAFLTHRLPKACKNLISLWHEDWRSYNVEHFSNQHLTTDEGLEWADLMRLNEFTFYTDFIGKLEGLFDQVIAGESFDTGTIHWGRVGKFICGVDELLNRGICWTILNAASPAGGAIFPIIGFTRYDNGKTLEVSITEDLAFAKRVECCSAESEQDVENIETDKRKFSLTLDFNRPDFGPADKIDAIEMVVGGYANILYSQMNDAFGTDMAWYILTGQQNTYQKILREMRNNLPKKDEK